MICTYTFLNKIYLYSSLHMTKVTCDDIQNIMLIILTFDVSVKVANNKIKGTLWPDHSKNNFKHRQNNI